MQATPKSAPIRLRLVVQATANEPIKQQTHPQSRLVAQQPAAATPVPTLNPPEPAPIRSKLTQDPAEIPILAPQTTRSRQTAEDRAPSDYQRVAQNPQPPKPQPPSQQPQNTQPPTKPNNETLLPPGPPKKDALLPMPPEKAAPRAAPAPIAGTRYSPERCRLLNEESAEVRTTVRENLISKISLDITPTKRENLNDPATNQRRQWRNRDGEVVATGKFSDFKNGRIWVEQEDGSMTRVPYHELSDDDHCFVAFVWGIPVEFALDDERFQDRQWVASSFAWKASEISHKPLYFEEVQLERYGHTLHPLAQPVFSGAHFFLNIAVLPYKMGIHPLHECQYPLGYYRPGSCAPWLMPPVPLSVRGGLAEAGVILGGVFLLP